MAKLQSQLRRSKYLTRQAGKKPSWRSGFQPFGLYNELRLVHVNISYHEKINTVI